MDTAKERPRILTIEVAVVVLLCFVPSILTAWLQLFGEYLAIPIGTTWASSAYRLVYEASRIAVVLFIAWGSGDRLSRFGLLPFRWWQALPFVFAAILYQFLAWRLFNELFWNVWPREMSRELWHLIGPRSRPLGLSVLSAFRLIVLAIAVLEEEFVARGYLIRRLQDLTGGYWKSAAISSLLFALYHVYEGLPMLFVAFGFGMLMALSLRVTKSIWPGVVAHFLVDALVFARAI